MNFNECYGTSLHKNVHEYKQSMLLTLKRFTDTLPRLRTPHARDISDLWCLRTGGECLRMTWWLRACWAISGTHNFLQSCFFLEPSQQMPMNKSQQRKVKQPGSRSSFCTNDPPSQLRDRNTSHTSCPSHAFLTLPCFSPFICQIFNKHFLNQSQS